MGKYERGEIQEMEKSVVNLLNNKPSLISKKHKWFRHMVEFYKYIKNKYRNIKEAEWIGNKYNSGIGDIKIKKSNDEIEFIELKTSETPKGRGTLANISQNAITIYKLVGSRKNKILSWSEFRNKNKFSDKVINILNGYKKDFINKKTYDKAHFIKKRATKGDIRAKNIEKSIKILAKNDKKNYLNYIRKYKINNDSIRKFVFCMLRGIHTIKKINDYFNTTDENLIYSTKEFTTLYSNEKGSKVVITERNIDTELIFDIYNDFYFSFPESTEEKVYTYIFSKNKKTNQIKKIIGLTLHWKNIFQGIKTPCINVFLGRDLN